LLGRRVRKRAVHVGDEFVEAAIAETDVVGKYLAVAPDYEEVGDG
jgi:hypothetical protein